MSNGNVGTFKRAHFVGEDSFAEWARPYAALNLKPQTLRRLYDQQRRDVVYLSEHYQVAINKQLRHGFAGSTIWWLSIKRIDKQPIMDWRDLQAIKSQLCGAEAEAIQLFPAESRVVDTSNQYHLYVFMKGTRGKFPRLPIGFDDGQISDHEDDTPWKQRPLDKVSS